MMSGPTVCAPSCHHEDTQHWKVTGIYNGSSGVVRGMQAEGLIKEIATEEEHDHNGTVVEHAHDSPRISRMFFSNNGGWAALLDEAVLMYRYARALLSITYHLPLPLSIVYEAAWLLLNTYQRPWGHL